MKKSCFIVTGATLSALVALAGASAQTPSSPQPAKPSANQRLPEGVKSLSGAAADDLIIDATGDTGVDKAAVKAREERYAAASQIVSEGESLLKQGRVNDAIASYKAALDITPDDGLAYQRMGEAYMAAGKWPEANRAFHKFLVEGFGEGNGGVVNTPDEWAEYALVLAKTNQRAEAVQAYNHAAYLLDYEVAGPEKGRSKAKVLLPELSAEPTAPEQVQYTPERLQALADTALAHEEIGLENGQKAIAHMKEAVTLYPDSAAVHYYLGEVLPSRTPEQKAAYKKAAELGDDATVAAAKERLAVLP